MEPVVFYSYLSISFLTKEGSYECIEDVPMVVPCPDVNHCFSGVSCIMSNDSRASYITCGNCPQGYIGDGIHCKPQCHGCDSSFQVCIGPEQCKSELIFFLNCFLARL